MPVSTRFAAILGTLLTTALLTSGCTETSLSEQIDASAARRAQESVNSPENAARMKQQILARMTNATIRTFAPKVGTRVEYTSADGRAYLWYPGNDRVAVGQWQVKTNQHRVPVVCFDYPIPTQDPLTGKPNAGEDCTPVIFYGPAIAEQRPGDAFGLTKGKVPFVLPLYRHMTFKKMTALAQ